MSQIKRSQLTRGLLAPSLLSADFSKLGEEVKTVVSAGADWIHLDVMDGHFVPNITMGPEVLKSIRPHAKVVMDCHLMVSEPDRWLEAFAQAGANVITVHAEATVHLNRTLKAIRDLGCMAGVSLNPSTPLTMIEEVLDEIDLVLVMSVNPGFGGQSFIESTKDKVTRLVEMREDRNFLIEIDGGVDAHNIQELRKLGVDVFVAGSAVFKGKPQDQVAQLVKLISG